MVQHAILRFEKHKGNPARPLEAHHERQKEQYASNPDIDTSRRDAITTSFKAALNRLAAAPAGTAPGLWIR